MSGVKLNSKNPNQVTPIIAGGKLKRPQALGLAITGSVLAITGIALGVFRYIIPSDDAFSAYPHRLWPWTVMVHVLATPVFFFYFGSIWWGHVVRHWRTSARRISGVMIVALTVVLSASGYALYFVGREQLIGAARAIHTIGGLVVVQFYVYHAVIGWRLLDRNGRPRPA